ncbi:flagellar hook-associated family protein [Methylocystis echinoides]|jgi:flagellar hook-associated protein 3 FlgL|uniref:flagellar hook-associated family protein n=1 Tax=Methylocystis echinoides TaxID=29468 RepID=UPI003448C724
MLLKTSTYSITASLRQTVALLQSQLARGQKEITTGRHADLAIALGVRASESYAINDIHDALEATLGSNRVVSTRLDTTQAALSALLSDAQQMRSSLVVTRTTGGERAAIITQASQSLTTFIGKLNSSNADGFLFGGVSTDQEPIANYVAVPPSAAKLALDAAFSATFGFTQSDPAVASITSAQMQSFLSGPFDALFSDAGWKSDWSSASDVVLHSQIGLSVSTDASISANEPAMRKIASAYAMLSDIGAQQLSNDAYNVLVETAMDTLDSGIRDLMKTRARVGVMQNTVKNASDTMATQKDYFDAQLQDLEAVDPTEATTRVNNLMTRIETAYTLTARINQLSLTKYL